MIELTEEPIDPAELLKCQPSDDCGAVLMFLGNTRRWTGEHQTLSLHYEAYREMAVRQLEQLAEAARRRWPVRHVAILHRLGPVEPTETSLAVVVASPHRKAAFEAGEWLIDRLKAEVAIWKREQLTDGRQVWHHPDPPA